MTSRNFIAPGVKLNRHGQGMQREYRWKCSLCRATSPWGSSPHEARSSGKDHAASAHPTPTPTEHYDAPETPDPEPTLEDADLDPETAAYFLSDHDEARIQAQAEQDR